MLVKTLTISIEILENILHNVYIAHMHMYKNIAIDL